MYAILIVEYHKYFGDVLTKLLELEDYSVERAANGATALKSIRRQKPDLIISANFMLGMTGIELLKVIKVDTDLKTIPFVLISANPEALNPVEIKKLGAAAILSKSCEAEELLTLIQNTITMNKADFAYSI